MIAPGSTISLWKGVMPPIRQSMPQMIEDIADRYGVTVEDLKGTCTKQRSSVPRQHFMWLAYQQTHLSLPMIGRFLNRDHSSVLHGIRQHRARLEAIALEEAA